ncbi:MAG: hypothetical protein E7359_02720 [Clostridiales bacterium]|nr:hypothetical protein [Clostridiales bacterium]
MKNCINKFTKITLKCLTVFAILAVGFLGIFSAPLMNIAKLMAETDYTQFVAAGLKLLNMPKSAKLNQVVKVPFGKSDSSSDVINTKILNPKGEVIFDNFAQDLTIYTSVVKNDTTKTYDLTPNKVGTYKVQYSVEGATNRNLAVQEYKIVVTGVKPVISFEENTKYIIPSVTNGSYQIVLPNPLAVDSQGYEVAEDKVLDNLEITVKDSYTNTSYNSDLAIVDDYFIKVVDGHYAFTPNAEADCTYTVTYTYTDISTGLTVSEVFEINYEKAFDANSIDLGFKFNGSMPDSLELGVEKTLPTVSVYDNNDSELKLEAYTDVNVVFVPNSTNASKYESLLDDGKDYITVATSNVVTPMYPTTDGTYKITYKISDFYNLSQNKVNKTLVYTINDVKDSTAPKTYAVKDYKDAIVFDTQDTTKVVGVKEDYEPVEVEYMIPTKVATGTEVYLPAIFAKDNFTKYENMLSSLKRVIVPESGSNTTVTTCYKEVEGTMQRVTVSPYETASYKFETPGTYTVRYEAKDEAGKYNYTGLNFTIVVEDGFVDEVAPKITMTGVPSTSKPGEVVSFNKPKVVDYIGTSSVDTDVVDKKLEIGYYYYTGSMTLDTLKAELNKVKNNETSTLVEIKEDEKDSNKLSFIAPESNVTVVAVAYDDSNNQSIEQRSISIVNIVDTTAPVISTTDTSYVNGLLSENLKQDEIINLPSLVVTDGENADYLEGHVTVVDKDGNSVSVIGAKYTISNKALSISNARFVATKSGEYTINYTINDIGGNYVVKSYIVSVTDTKAPTIEVDSTVTTVEVGETFTMPTITVKDNGEVLTNAYSEIRFVGDNNPSYRFNNGTKEFTALEAGVFTYEYYAKDEAGNETISGPYTFTAKDTINPTIELDRDLNADKHYPLEKEGDVIKAIYLPGFTAEDELNGIKETKVEVLSPSSKSLTVKAENDGTYSFVPTVDGVYTIVYTAIDNANNQTKDEYLIKIGDNTVPSIVINNQDVNAPSELKINSTLELDLSEISVSDAGTTKTAEDLTSEYTNNGVKMFTVKVTGPDGSTISVNDGAEYEYTLSKTGKYTITYTARDKAGNEEVIKKYVEVYADDSNSVISSETWGVVLIVVSLAILGGVVIYFIKTRDKKPTAKKLTDKKDNKND